MTVQARVADDGLKNLLPCIARQYVNKWRNGNNFLLQRRKTICVRLVWHCTPLSVQPTTANRINQSEKINRSMTQMGCKIILDADLPFELAGRTQCGIGGH